MRTNPTAVTRLAPLAVVLLFGLRALAEPTPSGEITAISSRVYSGYSRTMLPDGAIRPEHYGLAVGGDVSWLTSGLEESTPPPVNDSTIDKVNFAAISRMIQGPLESQKYIPTSEPRDADLLIVVFWGRSVGSGAFSQSGSGLSLGIDQDLVDLQNARLMGFDSTHLFDQGFSDPSNMMANIRRQVHSRDLAAVKEDRYFVILRAFDFQAAWKQKQIRLLWETRFSVSQRGHDFRKDLPGMAMTASQFFGHDTHGLVEKPIPEGRVEIGVPQSLSPTPEK
jgi:hypothetical protein